MPSTEVWAQYPLIAVIVLVVAALALGARRFWREFTDWQDKQDAKRDAEREKQREWQERLLTKQEEINEKREARWQEIYRQLMLEVTTELKCLRNDLGDHHQVALKIAGDLERERARTIAKKRMSDG